MQAYYYYFYRYYIQVFSRAGMEKRFDIIPSILVLLIVFGVDIYITSYNRVHSGESCMV